MQTANPTLVRTKRHWLPRFTLRTQIASIALIGVLFGVATVWYRMHQTEHDRQLRVAQQLKLAGAQVRWRSSAPDWIIESEYFGESPSINQLPVFRVLEFIEEINCLPDADLDRVFELLRELPGTSELSINIADLKPSATSHLSKLPQLGKLYIDYHRHRDWINDPHCKELATELHARLPSVEIVGCVHIFHESADSDLPTAIAE